MSEAVPSLHVDRAELIVALTTLCKLKDPSSLGEALVSLDEGTMEIVAPGLTVRARAEGTWPGQARVPIGFFIQFLRVPPLNDPVPVQMAGGRFYIEDFWTASIWQSVERHPIELPINASFLRVLALGIHHSLDAIARSGLLEIYEDAVRQRDEMIDRAVRALTPLGVARDDVARLVEDCLRRQESK